MTGGERPLNLYFAFSKPLLGLLVAAAVILRIVTMLYLHRNYYNGISDY